MELEQVWKSALAEIELQISRPNFATWFKQSQLIGKNEGTVLVGLPNNFAKEWIENKYSKIVFGALRGFDETIKRVEFVVQAPPNAAVRPLNRREEGVDFGQLAFSEFKVDPETNLNPRYTFRSFIVGKSNELAYEATQAAIQEVGRKYNPLFIYGGVGLGKTHLIQAAGNAVQELGQGKVKVKYVSSEKFTNDVIWAIRNKRMETVAEKYRLIDVLIIDDIQFVAGKAATEEEFFHTFNALYERNKQIIISSDRPPKFIPTLEERLRSRFEGGMIADIGYPDFELRVAIIRAKLQEKNSSLSEEVVNLVANKIPKSLRELEGVLNRILFYRVQRGEMTMKLAEQTINETIQEPSRNINPNYIIKTVAEVSEIPLQDLTNRSRKKEVAECRQIAMYLLRDMLGLSYPYIGRRLGRRDHTTVIYACEKIGREITKNPALNQKIIMIKEIINRQA